MYFIININKNIWNTCRIFAGTKNYIMEITTSKKVSEVQLVKGQFTILQAKGFWSVCWIKKLIITLSKNIKNGRKTTIVI